jgi:TRAP-type mannitol/chloroaromatic compound transport system permease large subunit
MSLTALAIAAAAAMALMEAPLFTVIAGLALACLYSVDQEWLALQVVLIELNRMASMPILVALPLFTFAGCLLTHTRAPQRVLALMEAVTGRFPGGLGIAALGACAFFTALTGASGVTIVALGGFCFPS